ncbi:type II toxin-antitoxin system Phd/YefM family antitoxin [Deferrisoma palaeochoriense]
MQITVSKSKLKPKLLEYLRRVATTGEELVVTDRGKPVARIVPYREEAEEDVLASLRGTVVRYDRPTDPVGEDDWEALS